MKNGENSYSYYLEKFHEAKNNCIHTNNTYYNTYYNDNIRGNKYYNILKYWCCLYRK